MRTYLLLLLLLFVPLGGVAQQQIELKPDQVEELFIKQNLALVAEQLNVPIAEAAIAQAKLWDNPSISLDGVNFWSSQDKRDGETIPPLWGSFGLNTQFSVELSQMISLSGKRAKLVRREKVSRDMALLQFEQVLLGLKLELRKTIADMLYVQQYTKALTGQQLYLRQLIGSYEKQYAQANIARNELIRLQSALLEIDHQINSLQIELNAAQRSLKNLLSAPDQLLITIVAQDQVFPVPSDLSLSALMAKAGEYRTELNLQKLQTEYHKKSVTYEKSLRVPDLNLNVGYDRRGGVWPDFVGFGVGLELPIFNRNQGAIKAASVAQKQSEHLVEQQKVEVANQVAEAYSNYAQSYSFYQTSTQNTVLSGLDEMLEVYTKNLLERNISMLEYMDFMDTYKTTKQTLLSVERDTVLSLEELKYAIGTQEIE